MPKHTKDIKDEKYIKSRQIGEGTFAVVYEGLIKESGRKIAIKKIKVVNHKEGLDISAIREIKFLQELSHPNIIELIDVYHQSNNINLVLEYLDSDLEQIIKNSSIVIVPADIKSWMLMLLRGLDACHQNFILHRDLKPNNLLLSSNGELKIADFGLSRDYGRPDSKMTSQVITRWYRPPELLFGAKTYTAAVDIWSCGAIFAELMLRTPYFAGESDLDQLKKIFQALGTPTEEDWPGMKLLPDYVEMNKYPRTPMRQLFTAASDETLKLLESMLVFDPEKRITCRMALSHSYFLQHPRPTAPEKLPNMKTKKREFEMSEEVSSIKPKRLFI